MKSLFYSLIFVALAALGFSQRYSIYDWARLYGYHPPAAIAQLATDDGMTAKAQHLFYINHPALETKADFNQHCPNNGGEQTIVLGCYRGNENGIYLYQVTDPQLDGVEQVTAAHETLHAAYQRLSASQKKSVDALLQTEFNNLSDPRIKAEMATYQRTEPTAVMDELHSILGTEDASLPPALVTYYQQYFTSQPKIAAFSAQYQAAFTTRRSQVSQYDAQLANLKLTIKANQATLASQSAIINSRRQALQDLLASDQTQAYNDQLGSFNALVDQYNNLIITTKTEIDQYNQLVDQRNAVAVEEQNLAQEINSNATTQTAQ